MIPTICIPIIIFAVIMTSRQTSLRGFLSPSSAFTGRLFSLPDHHTTGINYLSHQPGRFWFIGLGLQSIPLAAAMSGWYVRSTIPECQERTMTACSTLGTKHVRRKIINSREDG